jgi:hypothetical protein
MKPSITFEDEFGAGTFFIWINIRLLSHDSMQLINTISLLTSSCALAQQPARFETSVVPLPNEDMASACSYTLTIPYPKDPIRAVWVIFDRGHDVHDLYSDHVVLEFARSFRLALLLHGHCPGKAPENRRDMNMDPEKGLGRALFTALDQFGQITGHRELADTKLIFLAFSGAGPLSARFVGSVPDRVIAAILSAPGHHDPYGIDTVDLDTRTLAVPQMIIAGAADNISGTSRPYEYFRKYSEQGAPWSFVLQNKSAHCCTANAKELMLQWLGTVLKQRQPSSMHAALCKMNQDDGWFALMKIKETEIKDSFGLRTFELTDAKIRKSKDENSQEWLPAGWLASQALAEEWLAFVRP